MKKQPATTMATQKKITDTFWKLYCEKGINQVSVCQVAKEAGINRSTFYQYFTDIYDVLEKLEASLLDDFSNDISEKFENGLPNSLRDFSAEFTEIFAKYNSYLFYLLGSNGDPSFSKKLKNTLQPIILNAIGLDKNSPHLDYLTTFAFSSLTSLLTYWYESGQNISYQELAGIIQSLIATGVLGFTNIKLFEEQL